MPAMEVHELVRKFDGAIHELREVEQILGEALGYPRYADDPESFPDATAADGVCVGEMTPAALAEEIAKAYTSLRGEKQKIFPRIGEKMAKWLLVSSRNKPLVPDQVFQEVEIDSVLTDNGGKVPIKALKQWGYTLTQVRLVPVAEDDETLWSDRRINRYVAGLDDDLEPSQLVQAMRYVRDEYEMERKNKIFIPVELRGCLLSTIQKSKNSLADLISLIEERLYLHEQLLPGVQAELDGWKAEVAEYEAVLAALVGEQSVEKPT